MILSGKVWGETRLIELNGFTEMHHASLKARHQCSIHSHRTRWNGFYVLSGVLIVKVWQEPHGESVEGLVDITRLTAKNYTKVAPGKFHQFICEQDCELIELYWPEFDGSDIVRRTQGGALPPENDFQV